VSEAIGFQRHVPTPLLLIQPRKQEIHLGMQQLIRMFTFLLAMGTLTLMNFRYGHSGLSDFDV
jgi:hypothetical protein